MRIKKQEKNEAFVHGVDAESRVTVWAVNRANSPQISKLGLTHIPGGAADASGMKILHANGPGLTLEKHNDSIMHPGQLPYQDGLIPNARPVPQIGNVPIAPAIPQFFHVHPQDIPQGISEMTGEYDPVYIAVKLNLLDRNIDMISGPKLCREFREPQIPVPGLFNMECRDAEGNFTGRYVLFNGSVFEAKIFKYTDSPDGAYFYFAPSKSEIYIPQNCNGCFTTNANIAVCNPGMGWLCTADGVEKLDWKIIRRFGKNARLVWSVFLDDQLLTRNNFAEVFAIVTEAKRHGVEMDIVRAEATAQSIGNMWDAQESLLDDREIKKEARRYHLAIDPVWNDLPGEISFDDEPLAREVPPFWNGNHVTVFFGKTSGEFMQEFVTQRTTPWIDCGRVLLVVDEKDRKTARQVRTLGGGKVRSVTFDAFHDKDAFLEKVPSLADLIFIVPPLGDSEMKAITPEILDACTQTGLPVGIFSQSEDAPPQETAVDTVFYCVAKSQSTEDAFSVKNMKRNSIVNYKFSPAGVEETPGTEEDM